MRYRVLKSLKYIINFNNNVKNNFFNKIIIKNDYFYFNIYKYNKIKNSISSSSICKIRNRCIINGKSRSVYKKYRLSRHSFKEYSLNGCLNGITKK